MFITGSSTTGNAVAGNLIGTNAGAAAIGNGLRGVEIGNGASNNRIGGAAAGEANVIAFNAGIGMGVTGATSTGNSIRGNAIHHNGGLGIDLAFDGVTANDPGDADAGPNGLQNFPVLSAGSILGNVLNVTGTFNGAASSQYTIEFFANAAADASGHGEGEVFLGARTVTTGADGNASIDEQFTGDFTNLTFITATVTDAAGNTLEFSEARQAVIAVGPVLIIDDSDPPGPTGAFGTTGDWATGGGPDIGRNDNVHLAFGESFLPTDIATWTFNLPGPGRYRVSATWYTNPDFTQMWSTAARFEVSDGPTALTTALVNTQLLPIDLDDAGSSWENLGQFDITGSTLRVRLLSALDDRYVIADAIRVEKIANLSPAGEIHVTMAGESGVNLPDGAGIASFGTTDFNEPVQRTFTISNQGTADLTLTLPVTVTGAVFTVVTQPALTMLAPGQSTTFVMEMSGATTGAQ
ncbi:MAG: hypothetical protein HY000_14695, partial [Planctomycetes bacterium]|nr:hypothetical protein [Planctomycetota bacterium]